MGGIDQSHRDVKVAVVVVADLRDHKAGFACTDAAVAQLQAITRRSRHRNDAAMAVEQWQSDDPRGQQAR